jgi:tetratricopeptide (TPR) repeat protein
VSKERQRLDDERRLRETSLRDAAAELAAGELSSHEFAVIEQRERAALERVALALAALDETPDVVEPRRTRRRRPVLLAVALASFAVAATVLLVGSLTTRQPGQSATGSISSSDRAMLSRLLAEGEADVANNQITAALAAYDSALLIDAKNVTALTQSGWFYFSAGSATKTYADVARGVRRLRRAIALAPTDPAPRLYYGIAALSTPGNEALARRQFLRFLALSPSAPQRATAQPYLQRLGLAK